MQVSVNTPYRRISTEVDFLFITPAPPYENNQAKVVGRLFAPPHMKICFGLASGPRQIPWFLNLHIFEATLEGKVKHENVWLDQAALAPQLSEPVAILA